MRFAQEISIFNPNAIELAVTGLGTRITQTAQEIRLEAAKTLANYSTTVQMNSAISTKADEITLQVSETYATQAGVNSQVSSLSSRITQNANSITAEVTNRQNADTSLSSRITQNASAIELRVQKDELISTINQTAGSVKISASKIDLSGYVTISSLKQGGTTVVDGSRITTGFISADRIEANSISVGKLSGTISNGGWKIDLNTGTLTIGTLTGDYIKGGLITGTSMAVGDGSTGTAKLYINGSTGEVWTGNLNIMTTDGYPIGGWYQDYDIQDNARKDGHYMRLLTGYGIHVGSYTDSYKVNAYSIFDGGVRFRGDVYYEKTFEKQTSDRRLKHDIMPLQDSKRIIMGLTPVSFRYNHTDDVLHHGFVAQDVKALVQDDWCVVAEDPSPDCDTLYLAYTELIADVVAVIQSQERRITALEGRTDG